MTEDEIEAEVEERVQAELKRRILPLSWVALLVTFLLALVQFGLLVSVVPKFSEMFKEMDIGELPLVTQILLMSSRLAWAVVPLIFVIAVVFHRARRPGGLIVLSGLMFMAFVFEIVALFMPMVKIMNQLSGGRR